jgi:hypothetical protein
MLQPERLNGYPYCTVLDESTPSVTYLCDDGCWSTNANAKLAAWNSQLSTEQLRAKSTSAIMVIKIAGRMLSETVFLDF